MTTETPRVALYQRLTEVLGPDHASTLMTYLPTEEPATKTDIQDLHSAIRELKWDILGSRSELKSDISGLRSELKTDILELRSALKADIAELRSELKTDLREMEQRWDMRMGRVEVRLNK